MKNPRSKYFILGVVALIFCAVAVFFIVKGIREASSESGLVYCDDQQDVGTVSCGRYCGEGRFEPCELSIILNRHYPVGHEKKAEVTVEVGFFYPERGPQWGGDTNHGVPYDSAIFTFKQAKLLLKALQNMESLLKSGKDTDKTITGSIEGITEKRGLHLYVPEESNQYTRVRRMNMRIDYEIPEVGNYEPFEIECDLTLEELIPFRELVEKAIAN